MLASTRGTMLASTAEGHASDASGSGPQSRLEPTTRSTAASSSNSRGGEYVDDVFVRTDTPLPKVIKDSVRKIMQQREKHMSTLVRSACTLRLCKAAA